MTDPFSWSINLGRWGTTQVRVHLLFVLFAVFALLDAAFAEAHPVRETAGWLLLLLLAVLAHEVGHAAMAAWHGVEQDEVRLWPLGSLTGPSPASAARAPEGPWVAAAGPAMSLLLAAVCFAGVGFAHAVPVVNPFGYRDTLGAPWLPDGRPVPALGAVWWVGWFGYLNWVLFLVNLIPAPPLDGGRFLRSYLSGPWGQPRENLVAPYSAHTSAIILGLVGLFRLLFSVNKTGGVSLILLAILIELMVRAEARMMEDGGFFDDNLFGYDFSQGYTSLEAGAPTVRPARESALRRWRRRRSEVRRQRREAKQAAEERRMDEILAKLHSQGRSSLTDEEHRFLVRVSAKYRNKSKAK